MLLKKGTLMTIGCADIFGIVKFSSACSTRFVRFDKHSEKCNTVKRKFVLNKRPQAKCIVNPVVSVCLSHFRYRFPHPLASKAGN